ncbi:coproporphyrinogen III oxidase [Coxiella-like endosymbiont of Rhipicephalus sanguineus]|uniref:coproporphyrinogen III oxidase n=1 Tax=Coxiella-like endosymbiont of Rhipicephalus sanguineus TaxID=1955402 RepID=UPI00203D71CA
MVLSLRKVVLIFTMSTAIYPASATQKHTELKDSYFNAEEISLVIHAKNPYVPSTHGNFQFFIVESEDCKLVWWFGGGYDLIPYYLFKEDCCYWNLVAKQSCDSFSKEIFFQFKSACDHYFYFKHRKSSAV